MAVVLEIKVTKR